MNVVDDDDRTQDCHHLVKNLDLLGKEFLFIIYVKNDAPMNVK